MLDLIHNKGEGVQLRIIYTVILLFLSVITQSGLPITGKTEAHIVPTQRQMETIIQPFDVVKPSHYGQDSRAFESSKRVPFSIRYTKTFEVGYQRTFWSWDFTDSIYYLINATILGVGMYCYVFLENSCISELGESNAYTLTETICSEFDNIIYPRVTDLAGHPNGTLGDIDGDPRIVILLSRNWTSYYSQRNEQVLDYSNECEMIYIYYQLSQWPFYLHTTIAHEFHHLIWFNNEFDEPHFTLEGLAEYSTYHSGYLTSYSNLTSRVADFLPHPEDSLLYFNVYSEEGMPRAIDYGSAYLFTFYLAEKYGLDTLRKLVKEPADGPKGIENVLQSSGYNVTFNELYLNWITAVTIDEPEVANNLYGFSQLNAQISGFSVVNEFPIHNKTILLRYYGFHVLKLKELPDKFTLQIKKAPLQAIGVSLVIHDSNGWQFYQNLHDESNEIINNDFSCDSIDESYFITSYMLNQTPTDPVDFGIGPLTNISISIIQTRITTTTNRTSGYTLFPIQLIIGILCVKFKKKDH